MRIVYASSKFICKGVKKSLAENESIEGVQQPEIIAAAAVCLELKEEVALQ